MMEMVSKAAHSLDSGDGPEAYKAKLGLRLEAAKVGKPGSEEDKAKFAAALLGELTAGSGRRGKPGDWPLPTAKHSAATRRELARHLGEVAGAAEVSELTKLIDDLDVRDAVRRVLENIPGAEATRALVDAAVRGLGEEFKIGAILALGRRTGAGVGEALREVVKDRDPRIRGAAALALANHPEPGNDSLIVAALEPTEGVAPHADSVATRLRLAATLARSGRKAEAERIYRAVQTCQPSKAQFRATEMALKPGVAKS